MFKNLLPIKWPFENHNSAALPAFGEEQKKDSIPHFEIRSEMSYLRLQWVTETLSDGSLPQDRVDLECIRCSWHSDGYYTPQQVSNIYGIIIYILVRFTCRKRTHTLTIEKRFRSLRSTPLPDHLREVEGDSERGGPGLDSHEPLQVTQITFANTEARWKCSGCYSAPCETPDSPHTCQISYWYNYKCQWNRCRNN